jgi:hypothetical protein
LSPESAAVTEKPREWQIMEQVGSMLAWVTGQDTDESRPPLAETRSAWARPSVSEFSEVRGVPAGPHRWGGPR